MRESLSERFLDRLFGRPKRELLKPNCYGFARFELGFGPEEFRDAKQIMNDGVPTDDLKNADVLVFFDTGMYLGKSVPIHVVANKPDREGNIRHRSEYGKPVEPIQLNELIDNYERQGYVVVGYKIS